MQQEIQSFLQKKMNRKEFLRHVGLILLSLIGIGGVIQYMTGGKSRTLDQRASPSGYGTNPYGGEKPKYSMHKTFMV